jgi:hypothetical protein
MWSELERLIEERCARALRMHGPVAVDAGDSLIALYGALSNCQIAFERMERQPSPGVEADAVLAMDVVLATLHNVQPVLGVLEPHHAAELANYVHLPARPTQGCTKSRLKRQAGLLRHLLAIQPPPNGANEALPAAFGGARRRLARFIRTSYAQGELFAA